MPPDMQPGTGALFVERTVHALGTARFGAWHVKRYAVAVSPTGPRPQVVHAADAALTAALTAALPPDPEAGDEDADDVTSFDLNGRPARVGFAIIHEARPACFLQLNRWRDGVDLVQTYLTAPLDAPERWTPVTGGAIGCVWELPVIAHERDAWVRHVLAPGDGPHLPAYLDDVPRHSPRHSPGENGPAATAATARIVRVAGERFEVRLRDGDRYRFVYDYGWLTGPNEGYGFSASGGVEVGDDEHVDRIRTFLAGIDPATGYLAEP